VGIDKTINVTGITLNGADMGNYVLTTDIASAIASITSKSIDITMSDESFVYDGTAKSLVATNSENVAMKYTNNAQIDVNTYEVTAEVDDPNYSGFTTAILTITPKQYQ